MKIAIIGLGKMGKQIAKKLHENGHTVVAYNRSKDSVDEMAKEGMMPAYTRGEVVSFFKKNQIVLWMMINAENVDQELNEWLKILPKKSILIDGGNSDFRLTKKRAELVSKKGSFLMDVGTSGGVWGYKNGFCMMVGGDKKVFKVIEPILKTLSKPSGTYQYFGKSGSGHYVKMVHNAIEYGMMESLAEGYRLLKEGPYKNLDLAAAGAVWQKRSVITSWLNELTANILKENPKLKGVDGKVSELGETRYALETAKNLNIEMPSIRASFDVRIASQKGNINFSTKLLALMRNAFGGHKINPHT
jgi:6-phosphogluconate dehydrogenase